MILVTPPVGPVVSLDDLRDQVNADPNDRSVDALIMSMESEAVAYLDGWGGVLGRAIKAQTWRAEVGSWGTYVLPLPDVSAVAVTYLDADGAEQPATSVTIRHGAVTIDGPAADRIYINMTAAMAARYLPTVQSIVKMMVAARFDDRLAGVPAPAQTLITSIRHGRI